MTGMNGHLHGEKDRGWDNLDGVEMDLAIEDERQKQERVCLMVAIEHMNVMEQNVERRQGDLKDR